MYTYVQSGQTYLLRGTLGSGDTLVAEAGGYRSGAKIAVRGAATNAGRIALEAAPFYGEEASNTGASLVVSGTLTNTGTIDAFGGVPAEHYSNGYFFGARVVDKGLLTNSGSIVLGSSISEEEGYVPGTGAVLEDVGVLNNSGALTIDSASYVQSGYGYGGASGGTLNVSGALSNSGYIDVRGATAALDIGDQVATGRGGVMNVLHGGTLHNSGYLSVGGGYGQGSGTLAVAGVLINTRDIEIGEAYPARYSGAATLKILHGGVLQNQDRMYVDGSTIMAGGGAAASPSVIDAGTMMNSLLLELNGGLGGLYTKGAGAYMRVTGQFTNTKSVFIEGGQPAEGYSGAGTGATLTNAGVMTNSAGAVISVWGGGFSTPGALAGGAGMLIDSGTMTNAGLISVYFQNGFQGDVIGPGGTLDVAGVLDNSGSIDLVSDGSAYFAGRGAVLNVSGVLTNTGSITLGFTAGGSAGTMTITASGTLTDSGTINGGSTLVNAGVIGSGGHGVVSGDIAVGRVINDGTISVAPSGAFTVDSSVIGSGGFGVFDLTAHATLTLGNAVDASQSVAFLGSGAALALGDAVGFGGTLDGLGAHDGIDFLGLDVTSASSSGDTLRIGLDTGAMLSLALGAPLTGVSLQLSGDGHGGTQLTLQTGAGDDARPPASPYGAFEMHAVS